MDFRGGLENALVWWWFPEKSSFHSRHPSKIDFSEKCAIFKKTSFFFMKIALSPARELDVWNYAFPEKTNFSYLIFLKFAYRAGEKPIFEVSASCKKHDRFLHSFSKSSFSHGFLQVFEEGGTEKAHVKYIGDLGRGGRRGYYTGCTYPKNNKEDNKNGCKPRG